MSKSYDDIQETELSTWVMPESTDEQRREKAQRETCRYPMMAKQMGLHFIDSSNMIVADCGSGPLGGVSSVIPCKKRVCIDPLKDGYAEYYDVSNYIGMKAEDMKEMLGDYDLIIVTNAMDHFENPKQFLQDLVTFTKPGCFLSTYHAINNALTHKHDAHVHNLNPEMMHEILDGDFETVWELKYPELRYGWKNFNSKVGQPAFANLLRKVTGYK